jgi:Zn-dependent protease
MPPRVPSRGIVLFRLGPIEVAIHPSWLIMFAIIAWIANDEIVPGLVRSDSGLAPLLAIAIALLFYSFILLHELSHAVVARMHGIDARRITLFLFGGVAQIGAEAQEPRHEFRIAVAGPLMSLWLAGVLTAAARLLHPGQQLPGVWGRLALLNLFLAAFNLIPAFPLDGGRLLRAGLWAGLRDRARATRWAANAGKGFAFGLMGLGGAFAGASLVSHQSDATFSGLWYIVLGYFLFTIAGSAGRTEGGATPRGPGTSVETEPLNRRPFQPSRPDGRPPPPPIPAIPPGLFAKGPMRPAEPAVKVGADEGQAPEPDARGGGAGPPVGPDAPRPPADQP